jgi:protoporphyrinogen oxidase
MMVAEHTNFVDRRNYDNKHMIWVGKYLDQDNPLWTMKKEKLLEKIIPYLKKINPNFEKSWIKRSFFTRFEYAQPIMTKNYSKLIPKMKTPISGLYIANMNNVYPWDRGTNYALKAGKEAAIEMEKEIQLSQFI